MRGLLDLGSTHYRTADNTPLVVRSATAVGHQCGGTVYTNTLSKVFPWTAH